MTERTHHRRGRRRPVLAGFVPLTGLLLIGSLAGAQGIGARFGGALKEGQFDLDFRYRYELVDDAAFGSDANASILWTRLLYTSAADRDVVLALNVDDVHTIGPSDYNSTRNGKTQYPVVPDPTGAELNLATITYSGLENARMVFGRQRIKRANDRFISNVPWRQNETTYDGASIDYAVNDRLEVFYSFANRVNRAFGPDSGFPSAEFGGSVNLLDATFTLGPGLSVMGYGYWLDFDDAPEAPGLSTRTIGTRVSGSHGVGERWALTYVAEYARQSDLGANPASYGADYYDLEVGLRREGFSVNAGYEVLGGSGVAGEAAQTPLGLVHNFQGWADKFPVTPPAGVADVYIAAGASLVGGMFTLAYHDFSADSGGGNHYGDELDFSAAWTIAERYTLWTGFALYDADTFSTDTDKIWIMLSASF